MKIPCGLGINSQTRGGYGRGETAQAEGTGWWRGKEKELAKDSINGLEIKIF